MGRPGPRSFSSANLTGMINAVCPLDSGSAGPSLRDRPDYEYGVPHLLSYYRCSSCGLVFADPIPEDDIGSFYVDYTTHGQLLTGKRSIFARLSRGMTLREFDAFARRGPLLDYGCGDGSFLTELANRGQRELVGYDFDPLARAAASASGATIVDERALVASYGPYATITLNHVVEHLVDPVGDIAWLGGLLRPGGRIVMRTPNANSTLSRAFGSAWRGWETPRHLHIYTPKAIDNLAASPQLSHLALRESATSQAMFFGIFHGSAHGEAWQRPLAKILRHALAISAFLWLTVLNRIRPVGEEIVVVLERRR